VYTKDGLTRFISSHTEQPIVTEGFLNTDLHPNLMTSVRAWQPSIASTYMLSVEFSLAQ
jgi:hypothetical protein